MDKISFCSDSDLFSLKTFIKTNWDENHIFVRSDLILDYQHKDRKKYNFVIGKNKNNEITGALGFIPPSFFDKELSSKQYLWLALWKVNLKIASNGLGFRMLHFLESNIKHKIIGAVGINNEVEKLYQALGYSVGSLSHYYQLNHRINRFNIIKILNHNIKVENTLKKSSIDNKCRIKKIEWHKINSNFITNFSNKSIDYITKKYKDHPIYNYEIYEVKASNELLLYIIIRKVIVKESNCIRIIDMIGNFNNKYDLEGCFQYLIHKHNSEYIDCYNYGINEDLFYSWGFKRKNKNRIIVPNYFEPFIQKNIKLKFAVKSNSSFYIFKGDSDQDRPNLVTN